MNPTISPKEALSIKYMCFTHVDAWRTSILPALGLPTPDDKPLAPRSAAPPSTELADRFRDLIKLVAVSGGVTNRVLAASLTDKAEKVAAAKARTGTPIPSTVIVRLYGGDLDFVIDLKAERTSFRVLAEEGLGPALLGEFDNARLEQFLPGRTLSHRELKRAGVAVCRQLALLHDVRRPELRALGRGRPCLLPRIFRYHRQCLGLADKLDEFSDAQTRRRGELRRVRRLWEKLQLKVKRIGDDIRAFQLAVGREGCARDPAHVVFCHNDLNENNLLLLGELDSPQSLALIDYEYAGLNYRAFDLGNTFCEMAIDNNYGEFPFFRHMPDAAPNTEEKARMARAYLEARRDAALADRELGSTSMEIPPVDEEEVRLLVRQATLMELGSHLIWGLWGVLMARYGTVEWSYLQYANLRLGLFESEKGAFLGGDSQK